MKKNDIYEKEFDGKTLRFQLTELNSNSLTIKTLDTSPHYCKNGNTASEKYPEYALAAEVDGAYVTTEYGDHLVDSFAVDINNRIKARNKSLLWLTTIKGVGHDKADILVNEIDELLDYWEAKFLPAIVRWTWNGEFNPNDETDIKRMKDIFSSYLNHLKETVLSFLAKRRGQQRNLSINAGHKVKFEDTSFKRINKDGTIINLESMTEVEDALRLWSQVGTSNNSH